MVLNECFYKRKNTLVLKKKCLEKFQYFMKISGKSYYRLQQFHKICLHIFPFQNILHLLLFSRKTLFYIFLRLSLVRNRKAAKKCIGPATKKVRRLFRGVADIFFFNENSPFEETKYNHHLYSFQLQYKSMNILKVEQMKKFLFFV